MPSISPITKLDIVSFKAKLSENEQSKIIKFNKRLKDKNIPGNIEEFILGKIFPNPEMEFKVGMVLITQKVPTEYAIVYSNIPNYQHIPIKIQTRYLKIIKRIPRHALTDIFSPK